MIKVDRRKLHTAVTELKRTRCDAIRVELDKWSGSLVLQVDALDTSLRAADLTARVACSKPRHLTMPAVVVGTKALHGALSPRADGDVTLRTKDGKLLVDVDGLTAKLTTGRHFERALDKVIDPAHKLRLVAQHEPAALDGLRWVARAMGRDELRKHLLCVALDYDDEGLATIVATDGHRMHTARLVTPCGAAPSVMALLPDLLVNRIGFCAAVSDDRPFTLYAGTYKKTDDGDGQGTYYEAEIGDWSVRCVVPEPGLHDHEFPAWRSVTESFQQRDLVTHVIKAEPLTKAVKKLQATGVGKHQAVMLSFQCGPTEDAHASEQRLVLSLAGDSADVDGCELSIPSTVVSECLTHDSGGENIDNVGVAACYLLDAVMYAKPADTVRVAFRGELEPVIIEQDNRTAYVMPVRIVR